MSLINTYICNTCGYLYSDSAAHKCNTGVKMLPTQLQGWQCPKCQVVYAPSVTMCLCSKATTTVQYVDSGEQKNNTQDNNATYTPYVWEVKKE